ncbi:gamma-type small acid-soluble spore protein [Bacillus sp. EB600]|uniref:gamma-type small acid-soluble spore protein n=1 Tax=Bacillus sp. EB600 TaxID=2806345 RepID=UPI00210EAE6D|nr:gamma-type small acid-soluble spore protein [Bacillus sp. EB600]MCQ6282502.1 gamma-type small acid-soluble spore protein [Bacillus sp. EB600]
MDEKNNQDHDRYTIVGTDIEEVKRLNANSGLSYNKVKALLAKTIGGRGTAIYNDIEKASRKNQLLEDK